MWNVWPNEYEYVIPTVFVFLFFFWGGEQYEYKIHYSQVVGTTNCNVNSWMLEDKVNKK